MDWDFAQLWNLAIQSLPERKLEKRDYIWASELGSDYCSRYLLMHGHKFSNPPNERSRRKFIMGHIVEWIVSLMLSVTGVIKAKQVRSNVELPGMLRVTGKLDFAAGGEIDWEKQKEEMKKIQLLFSSSVDDIPPIIFHALNKILPRMEMIFSRTPLKEYLIEIKSIASYIFDMIEKSGKPRPYNVLQLGHYIIADKEKRPGLLVYISKDDALMSQFVVEKTKDLLKAYRDDVATMTGYYNASGSNYLKNLPPKAPEVMFMEDGAWRFEKNFNVQWSKYLTMLYGYKDFDEFKWKWQYKVTAWNRVFKRMVRGDNLTTANKTIIEDMKKHFPETDMFVAKAKAAGAFQKPGEEDEE